jgi:hypothetical protein
VGFEGLEALGDGAGDLQKKVQSSFEPEEGEVSDNPVGGLLHALHIFEIGEAGF